jgi:uncharacterized protein
MSKYEKLLDIIKGLKKCAVCFSGGVDSFFLLYAATEALGHENVLAITFKTDFFAESEFERAVKGIKRLNVRHIIVELDMFANGAIRVNDENRCYYCKKQLLTEAIEVARKNGFENVIEGTNASDVTDYRPGCRALEELKILSPLKEAGLAKDEIIELLYKKGFFEVVRPPDACLATRIMQGEELTKEKLTMTEQAEDFIKILGYDLVRVRNVGGDAVIELDLKDMEKFRERHFAKVEAKLQQLGYKGVRLNEEGYIRGNMNKKN